MDTDTPVYDKPLPKLTPLNRPFWEAATRGELRLQRCKSCGRHWYPIEPRCPKCLGPEYEWAQVSGRGTVLSFVVFHQVYDARFRQSVPYNVALVELDEDVRMITNIVGIADDAIEVGMPVAVEFDPVNADVAIPRFRPRASNGTPIPR
jgi:uncharacterized OB-fold protein